MKYLWSIALAVTLLFASSCKKDDDGVFVSNPCGIAFNTTISYLACGDDFSAGYSLDQDSIWPSIIVQRLEAEEKTVETFEQVATSGTTTAELWTQLQSASANNCKNLATILVGSYDIIAGVSPEQFAIDYRSLIQTVKQTVEDPDRVICVNIPDWSKAGGRPSSTGTDEETSQKIAAFNDQIAIAAAEEGVRLHDIFTSSQTIYHILIEDDGFVPNEDLHELWGYDIFWTALDAVN